MEATHEQLRRAREGKGLTLAALQERTGVRQQILRALERGAYGELPSGLYARNAVRAYASAVGLDANGVLQAVEALLPVPEDPIDGLARVRGFERAARAPRESRAIQEAPPVPGGEAAPDGPVPDWRTVAATVIDAVLILAIGATLVQLTVFVAGAPLSVVAAAAAPVWTLILTVIATTYFVLLGGERRQTLGARVMSGSAVRTAASHAAQFSTVGFR